MPRAPPRLEREITTPGREDFKRVCEKIALESGWWKKPREGILTWTLNLNHVYDLGQATSPCWVSTSPIRWSFHERGGRNFGIKQACVVTSALYHLANCGAFFLTCVCLSFLLCKMAVTLVFLICKQC